MWNINDLKQRLSGENRILDPWGLCGEQAILRIEAGLNVKISGSIREFVFELGNLRIPPFSIVLSGDMVGRFSAVTQSKNLWNEYPFLAALQNIKLMEHAGEDFFYSCNNGDVMAFESVHPIPGMETLRWSSFDEFMNWIIAESNSVFEKKRI